MTDWPRRWRGRWIWWERVDLDAAYLRGERPARPADGIGYLRHAFHLDEAPARARCRITCDGRYRLWVNDEPIGRGPVRSEPWALTFDSYALTGSLRAGENVIAITTRHYGGPTTWWKPARPVGALGYGSLVFEADLGGPIVASDGTWRARIAPYTRTGPAAEGPPPDEDLDARAIPHGWRAPGFDDSSWDHASVVDPSGPGIRDPHPPTEPFGVLAPRPIPPLRERIVLPASRDGDTFDFGTILNAHPILEIDADAGARVEIRAGEDLDADGAPILDVRSWRLRYTAAGIPDEQVEAFEPVGFRYARVEIVEGSARALDLVARERTYPRAPGAAFSCSDPALEAIWNAGIRTVDACSTDAFIDGPGREARAWLGDAYGHALVSLLANPDTALVQRNLRMHAEGARGDGLLPMVAAGDFSMRATTIPDFSLLWILALHLTHAMTGDAALIAALMPTGVRALDAFERWRGDDDLLHDVPGWVFIDWAQLERGTTFAPLDAMLAMALDAGADLLTETGDAAGAASLGARADATRRAFDSYWDPARGLYLDTIGGSRVSQHTNALAILSGAAPRARWDAMLDAILDPARLMRTATPADGAGFDDRIMSQYRDPVDLAAGAVVEAQPFFSHFVHQAVARAGRHEALPDLIRRWTPMVAIGNGCLQEYWDVPPGRGSRCHAWASIPVFDLATHIVGIRPASPGWRHVIVEPHLGDLTWAEASVTSPLGWIRARVAADGTGWVELPTGARGIIRHGDRTADLRPGRTTLT